MALTPFSPSAGLTPVSQADVDSKANIHLDVHQKAHTRLSELTSGLAQLIQELPSNFVGQDVLTELVLDSLSGTLIGLEGITVQHDDVNNLITVKLTDAIPDIIEGTGIDIIRDLDNNTVTVTVSTIDASKVTTGRFDVARLGSGTAGPGTVLYGDGSWKAAPTGGGGGTQTMTLAQGEPVPNGTPSGTWIARRV